jgi:hypothetical protein
MFVEMELDLPTPVSHSPLQEHAHTAAQRTQKQKYVCKYMKMDVRESKRNF